MTLIGGTISRKETLSIASIRKAYGTDQLFWTPENPTLMGLIPPLRTTPSLSRRSLLPTDITMRKKATRRMKRAKSTLGGAINMIFGYPSPLLRSKRSTQSPGTIEWLAAKRWSMTLMGPQMRVIPSKTLTVSSFGSSPGTITSRT